MEPPHCFQPMYSPPFFRGQEDCLYLNVFTPMVKIKGEGIKNPNKMRQKLPDIYNWSWSWSLSGLGHDKCFNLTTKDKICDPR